MLAKRSNNTSTRSYLDDLVPPDEVRLRPVHGDAHRATANPREAVGLEGTAKALSLSKSGESAYRPEPAQTRRDSTDVQVSSVSSIYSRDVLREVNAAVSNANGVIDANGLRPDAAARLMDYVGGEWVDFKVMHKLLYFSEVATRYLSNGKWGFVQGTFVADETGPILSELEPISPTGSPRDKITGVVSVGPYAAIAQHTYDLFGDLSADLLSEISHVSGGAWEKARERKSEASDGMVVMLREQIMSDYERIFEDHGTK